MWQLPLRRIALAVAAVIMATPAAVVLDDVVGADDATTGHSVDAVLGGSGVFDHVLLRTRIDVARVGGERQSDPVPDDRIGLPAQRRMRDRAPQLSDAVRTGADPRVAPTGHTVSLRAPPGYAPTST